MAVDFTIRQRRWLNALLVLGTVAVGFVVLDYVGQLFFAFGDIILIFFLAWLLAFILSPIVNWLTNAIPFLPRVGATILVYAMLLGTLVLLAVVVAGALVTSIRDFAASVPQIQEDLPGMLQPWQDRLRDLGLGQIVLADQAAIFLGNLNRYAEQLIGPLQQIAVASLGAVGTLVLVLIMSLYIVIDRDRIVSFLFRLVPPGFKDGARLLETSVARSFGGFLRGQAVMGVIYGFIALTTSALLGLPYAPVTSVLSGLLQAVPFFGPFVSWAPPVLVAIFTDADRALPAAIAMGVGWFLVMNVLQPRLMEESVGIHPIAVLGSVLIGSEIAGIPGAIFGIPIAAILSAFFFYYLGRTRDSGRVADRAAERVKEREGRPVRVPREPNPEVDGDVPDARPEPATAATSTTSAAATRKAAASSAAGPDRSPASSPATRARPATKPATKPARRAGTIPAPRPAPNE